MRWRVRERGREGKEEKSLLGRESTLSRGHFECEKTTNLGSPLLFLPPSFYLMFLFMESKFRQKKIVREEKEREETHSEGGRRAKRRAATAAEAKCSLMSGAHSLNPV